jgi:hypothetical protein
MYYLCFIINAVKNINAMTHNNTIAETINDHAKVSKEMNGRIAVIVSTPYTARKASYGVQFWTPEMIEAGKAENTDRTVSIYIQNL